MEILLIYIRWFGKNLLFFRTKFFFPNQRLILSYQRLSFPYAGLSLREVRESEAGKFADNIAFANNIAFVDFPLLGAYS